jgi:orotate phosphoribosyltransferase-like protein
MKTSYSKERNEKYEKLIDGLVEVFRREIKRQKSSHRKIAEELGVSTLTVTFKFSKNEKGERKRDFSLKDFLAYCDVLDIHPSLAFVECALYGVTGAAFMDMLTTIVKNQIKEIIGNKLTD